MNNETALIVESINRQTDVFTENMRDLKEVIKDQNETIKSQNQIISKQHEMIFEQGKEFTNFATVVNQTLKELHCCMEDQKHRKCINSKIEYNAFSIELKTLLAIMILVNLANLGLMNRGNLSSFLLSLL